MATKHTKIVGMERVDYSFALSIYEELTSYYKDNAFACKSCGKKFNTANQSWVVHTGYTKCSVCGRLKETQADYIRDPRNYLAMN